MTQVYSRLNADHLLEDTCTHYTYTGASRDATTLERTETYAAGVTAKCLIAQPNYRWTLAWPQAGLIGSREIWLPEALTVAPKDKIVHKGLSYRVLAVADWQGFQSALLERIEGVT